MNTNYVIIFDLDGTLLDTNTLIYHSFEHVFKKYKPDYKLTKEDHISFLGPPLVDSFKRFFPEELVDELVECYRVHNFAHHEDYVTIYPTVKETLETLKNKGYRLAVFTTKYSSAALLGLNLFDLVPYFDMILSGDQVQKSKPDPEGIYTILNELKCDKAVMVGDSAGDILSGKNAGIYTVGVNWSLKREKVEELQPDIMINQMEDIIPFVERIK